MVFYRTSFFGAPNSYTLFSILECTRGHHASDEENTPEAFQQGGPRVRLAADQQLEKNIALDPQEQERVNILGVGVSALNMERALNETELLLDRGAQGYVCVTGVHGIMEAQSDEGFRSILNRSFLTTPDGMPTVWLGHMHGFKEMNRVYGPDYMLGLCERSVARGYRHFFYGGKTGVAEELKAALTDRFPGLQIVGTYTPPFRPLNPDEEESLRNQLETSQADIFWCGLSTPKQERFMAAYSGRLPVQLMVGVGAAFDLLSGNLDEAPDWMKRSGLQWFYRLIKEPKRLWRRYLLNNPKFAWLTFLQLTGLRAFGQS
jgi:N-acetylglucosaminyldiphosphoundecaprenol N-acetyl-beta-D-mannosaminyltransferase